MQVNGTTNWGSVADWVAAGTTLLLALVALFRDGFWSYRKRPLLKLEAKFRTPDCHKTTLTFRDGRFAEAEYADVYEVPGYYLRILVRNEGRTQAQSVRVHVNRLRQRGKDRDDGYAEETTFLPMYLKVTHSNGATAIPSIPPKMSRHVDLGYIAPARAGRFEPRLPKTRAENEPWLALALEVAPPTGTDLLVPGTYLLDLTVVADNAERVDCTIMIAFPAEWFEDEDRMFTRSGFVLKSTDPRGN